MLIAANIVMAAFSQRLREDRLFGEAPRKHLGNRPQNVQNFGCQIASALASAK